MAFMRPLWPTYLWTAKREDPALDARLAAKAIEINAQVMAENPLTFFDRTKQNIFETHASDPEVRRMGRMFVRAARDYIDAAYEEKREYRVDIIGWVNVQSDNDATPWHSHLGSSHIAAIYYCSTGEGGELLLEDPRPISRDWDAHGERHPERRYCTVKPEPGLLVLFPGFVRHATNRFRGDARVCWVADMTINFQGVEEKRVSEASL